MNVTPVHRGSSAGGNSGRVASSSTETKILRETVARLQQDLMHTKADVQRVTDQLNCLIVMVRRAWQGDEGAVQHVANIVGIQQKSSQPSKQSGSHGNSEETRALSNWVSLTVGLLNREYRRMEQKLQARQRLHLARRQSYLDDQIIHHRDMTARAHTLSHSNLQSASSSQMERLSAGRPPSAGKPLRAGKLRKPAVRHLYRKPGQNPPSSPTEDPDVQLADIFIEPAHNQPEYDKAFGRLYRISQQPAQPLVNQEDHLTNGADPDRMQDYADPQRYAQSNLFVTSGLLKESPAFVARGQRPISAVDQRQSDKNRSRVHSAVSVNGRPMKYETTRPVSSKKANRAKSAKGRMETGRGTSASKRWAQDVFITGGRDDNMAAQYQNEADMTSSDANVAMEQAYNNRNHSNHIEDYDDYKDCVDEEMKAANYKLKVRIKKPNSVITFENDLNEMNSLEEEFKKTTLDLQRKLGIKDNALVCG